MYRVLLFGKKSAPGAAQAPVLFGKTVGCRMPRWRLSCSSAWSQRLWWGVLRRAPNPSLKQGPARWTNLICGLAYVHIIFFILVLHSCTCVIHNTSSDSWEPCFSFTTQRFLLVIAEQSTWIRDPHLLSSRTAAALGDNVDFVFFPRQDVHWLLTLVAWMASEQIPWNPRAAAWFHPPVQAVATKANGDMRITGKNDKPKSPWACLWWISWLSLSETERPP